MQHELIGDIGGTNARFALVDPRAETLELLEQRTLKAAEFASLQHAAERYLADVGAAPRRASIAVACPVTGDAIRLTNRAWSFSREDLRKALKLDELKVLNDFGAVARAIPALAPNERETLHPGGEVRTTPLAPISVIGPGTGLGVALLVGDGRHGWQAIETEGGHVTFAPLGDEEQRIARWLNARHGRTSYERLLSGPGISTIDQVLAAGDEPSLDALAESPRDPSTIVTAALEGHDLTARQALARFCAVLGSFAGDAVLLHGARTVMIAGGIVPRFIPFLRSSAFRERFLAKGRFAALLETVAIHIVTHPQPGLLGAAVALQEQESP